MPILFNPKLRNVEIVPVESQGEEFFMMHDRSGIASNAAIPRTLGPLISLFDGTRNVSQIISAYALHSGEELPEWFVEKIINQLDEGLLLDSPRFEQERKAIWREFEDAPSRPAAHAGQSYPAEPTALRRLLSGFFRKAEQLNDQTLTTLSDDAKLSGIVVPHIDFTRGGPVEALAYQQLQESFDVIVILGIAHCGVRYPFCAAPKDYETPLGTAHVDTQFIEALQERVGPRLTAEQFAHKSEHSVEFVAVFLQYLEHLRKARIVPILCGGFHSEVRRGVSPSTNPDIVQFCTALRETVQTWEAQGQRVGLIASVDLAHVGPNFDHDAPPVTKAQICDVDAEDHEFLRLIEAGDAEGMHQHIARDDNTRNIDAHPAIYSLLLAFPELRAKLLHYSYAGAPSDSIVSFASMTLYEE